MKNQMNLIVLNDFISEAEKNEIAEYSSQCLKPKQIDNPHIKKIDEHTMGGTVLCDFSCNEITKNVIPYQGSGTFVDNVPKLYHALADRISDELKVSNKNVFFQYIVLGAGGRVHSHYDAGMPGYVTYKCNICVSGPDEDSFFVDGQPVTIKPGSLYCFEANLFKHWMRTSDTIRIHLSYGFIVPNEDLGWEANSPRIRLGERIWKAFMKT